MASKVIGIVSYLPDEEYKRSVRLSKLGNLISACNDLFDLPIYIVIQNYTEADELYLKGYKNVSLSENYTRLGIVGARRKLREWFLSSTYDCLIMLDDDCCVKGSKSSADKYIQELENHPGFFGEFKGSQLKLFAIYKDLLSKVDYENVNPENAEGFEDTVFVEKLRKQFPDKRFEFNRNTDLAETSVGVNDSMSTWYQGQNLKEMLKKTEEMKKTV